MPLRPLSFDPFESSEQGTAKLRPLDFDPFEAKAAPTLRPLDFDPFARKGLDQMPGAGAYGGSSISPPSAPSQPSELDRKVAAYQQQPLLTRALNTLTRGFYDAVGLVGGMQALDAKFQSDKRAAWERDVPANVRSAIEDPELRKRQEESRSRNFQEGISRYIENRAKAEAMPRNPALEEAMKGSFWEGLKADPMGVVFGLTGESLPTMAPALIVGGPTGPIGAATLAGMNSYVAEYVPEIMDSFRQAGVDITNPQAVANAINNPEMFAKAKESAYRKAVPVALFDALSFGIASKFLGPARLQGTVGGEALNVGAQVGAGGATGGAGEIVGQLAQQGKVTDWNSVFAEVAGEAGAAPVEVASAVAGRRGPPELDLPPDDPNAGFRAAASALEPRRAQIVVTPEIRAQTTADDINSPIPTELIEGGRQVLADAMGGRRSPVPSTDRPQESAPDVGGPTAPPPALEALPRAGGLPTLPGNAQPLADSPQAPPAVPGVSAPPLEVPDEQRLGDGSTPPVRTGAVAPPQPVVRAPVPQGPQPIPAPGPTVALPESVGRDQLVTRQDGTPWASETDARTARTSRPDLRGKAFEPVQVDGGWALRPVPPAAATQPEAPSITPQAPSIRQEAPSSPPIAVAPPRAPRLPPQAEGGADAITFLASRGGIRNDEGHDLLQGRNLQRNVPTYGKLIRQNGLSIDAAGEALWDAGYFGPPETTPRPTENQVLEFIEAATRTKAYLPEIQTAKVQEANVPRQRGANRDYMERLAGEYGIDPTGKTDRQLEKLLQAKQALDAKAEKVSQNLERVAPKLQQEHNLGNDPFELTDDIPGRSQDPAPAEQGPSNRQGYPPADERPAERPETGGRSPEPVERGPGTQGEVTAPAQSGASDSSDPPFALRATERAVKSPSLTDDEISRAREDLLADLKRTDPSGRLAMRLVKQINNAVTGQQEPNADGQYFRRLIEIAHQAIKDNRGKHVLNHEVIHALRDLNLFDEFEWRALVRAARSDKALMDRINRTYKDLPLGKRMEEAVAELFAQWSNGKLEAKGFLRTAMEKIKLVWEALSNLARGNRLTTARGVMRKVESGEVGAREPRETRDAEPRFSRSEKPFYSALTRAAEKAKDSKATPGQWIGILKNSPGVKQEELDWSGIADWLNTHAKPVTKEDLLAFLRANEVQVQEVVKGNTARDRNEIKKQMREIVKRNDNLGFDTAGEAIQALIAEPSRTADSWEFDGDDGQKMNALLADYHAELDSTTKFASYTLPGGENYRELLLTLDRPNPIRRKPAYTRYDKEKQGWIAVDEEGADMTPGAWLTQGEAVQAAESAFVQGNERPEFRSGHYDEPNILAHVRFNERADADGKRVLFIEEIQSDWHQKGRKQGYASKRTIEQIDADIDAVYAEAERREPGMDRESAGGWQAVWDTHPDLKVRHDALFLERGRTQAGGIPDAPFKTTWPELAFKRALRWAAENGFDSVAWTTGEQQAARYDLSKHIKKIKYTRPSPVSDGGSLVAIGHDGRAVINKFVTVKELPDVIGKEASDRLLGAKTVIEGEGRNAAHVHRLSGLDLKVGGEGMKGFYDQILPAFANKYGKKWGARVSQSQIMIAGGKPTDYADFDAYMAAKKDPAPVHSLPITPDMRASVMEGQPMFSRRVPEVKEKDTPPRRSDGTFASPTDPDFKAPKGTPAQQRAVNKAISADKPGGLWARARETYDTIRNTIKDEIIWATADEFYGQRKLGKHIMPKSADTDLAAWMAAGMARHSAGQIEAFLRHGAPKWNGDDAVLEQDKETSPGFYEIVAPLYEKGLDRLFEGYAYARRVKTQNLIEDGREHNITAEERDSLVALENEFPEFKRIFNQIQTFKKAVLDAAQDMGLIDKEQRKVWEQADHVPFYRVAEEEDSSAGPFKKRGLAGQSPQIGRLTGGEERFVVFNSEGEVVSRHETKSAANLAAKKLGKGHTVESAGQPIVGIIENLVKNFSHLIDASMKNYAAVLAVDDALQAGIAEKVGMEHTQALVPRAVMAKALGLDPKQEDGIEAVAAIKSPVRPDNDVISIRRDGKVEYYRIKDRLLYRGIAGLHRAAMSWWTKPLVKLKNIFTRSITATPAFMARNFFRDSQSAWLTTPERGYNVLSEMAKSVKALGTRLDDPRVKAIMAAGGDTGWYQNAPEDVVKQLRQMEADGKATLIGLADVRKWWRTWERIGRASEIANRVVTYDATLKASGSKRKAAFAAADLLDFQRRGGAEWMQFLTAVTPFLNARIQGLYKLGRLATAGDKQARKALLTKAGMMIAFSTTLAILNAGDDEDDGYNDLPEYVKDGSWVINLKRMGIEGEGVPRFILIPKPFELGVLLGTVPERAVQLIAGNDRAKDTWDALERTVVDTFSINPLGNPLVKETVEQWANRDFFTGRPIVNQTLQFLPPEQQYDSGTSETAKGLGKMFDASPARIEHAIRGFTGDMGMFAVAVADAIMRGTGMSPQLPSERIDEMPVVKSFIRQDPARNSKWVERFYDIRNEAEEVVRGMNASRKAGDLEGARELRDENRGLLRVRKELDDRSDTMAALNKQSREIKVRDDLTPDEKRRRLDAITRRRNEIAKVGAQRAETAR